MFVLCTAGPVSSSICYGPSVNFYIKDIDWNDISEYAPAALAAIIMPLTYSIANGIAIGFVSYVLIKALSGKGRSLNYASIGMAVVSVLYFVVEEIR
jgi:xanthine/uracil/vitamin C permease (AzgA family)